MNMDKKYYTLIILLIVIMQIGCVKLKNALTLQDGDIIFQRSLEPEHLVMNFLEIVHYNHCGVIIEREGKY